MFHFISDQRNTFFASILVLPIIVLFSGCPALIVVELEDIQTDTVLRAGTYIAREDITVSNDATLTVQPGVKIVFEQDYKMSVDGKLHAVGTEDKPIVFTGAESVRGFWGGLRLNNTNSTDNQLEYVTVEYGGNYYDGNLLLTGSSSNPTRVSINNCTFRQSSRYGLVSTGTVIIDGFENNLLTANQAGPASMNADHIGFLKDSSSFAANDLDIVLIPSGDITAAASWPGIDAFYTLDTNINVHAALTIEQNAVLEFEAGNRMQVDPDGSLAVSGASGAPVFFTGVEATPGYWGGLRFYNTNTADNVLKHAVFEYGGGYHNANVLITGASSNPSRIAIDNCTFRYSKEYGLATSGEITIASFSNNVLTENAFGAAEITADHARFLDATSSFTGNAVDIVHITSGDVYADGIWAAIDAPYLISTGVAVSAALEIAPGAVLAFDAGQKMTVDSSGSLNAVGTQAAPIYFTGAEATPGYWGGLRFYNSNNSANVLDYTVFEYGGGYYDANLFITGASSNPSQVTVTNSVFENSVEWGILLSGTVNVNADIATANSFADNASGDISGP